MTTLKKAFGIAVATGILITTYVTYNTSPKKATRVGTTSMTAAPVIADKLKNKSAAKDATITRQTEQHYVPGYSDPNTSH